MKDTKEASRCQSELLPMKNKGNLLPLPTCCSGARAFLRISNLFFNYHPPIVALAKPLPGVRRARARKRNRRALAAILPTCGACGAGADSRSLRRGPPIIIGNHARLPVIMGG